MDGAAFVCRKFFWVLRISSGLRVSRECRQRLERVMGLVMDPVLLMVDAIEECCWTADEV